MSDVTLRTNDVLVEGQLVVEGSDIHLMIENRKSAANTSYYRRALVHGYQDDLVVNYDNDYTGVVINGAGGIKLNGATTIEGVDVGAMINALVAEQERLLGAINVLARRAGAAVTPSASLAARLVQLDPRTPDIDVTMSGVLDTDVGRAQHLDVERIIKRPPLNFEGK